VMSIAQFYIERFYARGASRALPPTPIQRLRGSLRHAEATLRRRRGPA
jgi:polar amino acid transport system permease protein